MPLNQKNIFVKELRTNLICKIGLRVAEILQLKDNTNK